MSRRRPVADAVAEAEDPTTTAERLEELAAHSSARVRIAVADAPGATDDLLLRLAEDPHDVVRTTAAGRAHGRPALEVLAGSPDRDVRWVLAQTSPDGPDGYLRPETQRALAADAWFEVRSAVAASTDLRELFELLLDDPHHGVRVGCTHNARAEMAHVERLLTDRDRRVRAFAVDGVLHLDRAQTTRAARDGSADVRWALLGRPGVDRAQVATLLQDDPDEMVRQHARRLLAGPGGMWAAAGEREEVARREALAGLRFSAPEVGRADG